MAKIKCFHGTTLQVAKEIVSRRHFLITKKNYHWLGPGAYFFQDAPFRAWAWAVELCTKYPAEKPAVVVVDVQMKQCLDLLDIVHWPLIEESYREYTRIYGPKAKTQERPVISRHDGKKFPLFSNKELDRKSGANFLDNDVIKLAIMKYEQKTGKTVNLVRAAFIEGRELYESSFFYSHYHIQVAVINNEAASFEEASSLLDNPRILDVSHLSDTYEKSQIKWP